MNLRGLSALSQGRCDEAREVFSSLHADYPTEPFLAYNLAYANALLGLYEPALALLDDSVLSGQPNAIGLKMQCLHHLGRLEEAIELGKQHCDDPNVGSSVSGMLATLLFDADEGEQAQAYALRAPDSPGGMTVLGLLALEQDDRAEASNCSNARCKPIHAAAAPTWVKGWERWRSMIFPLPPPVSIVLPPAEKPCRHLAIRRLGASSQWETRCGARTLPASVRSRSRLRRGHRRARRHRRLPATLCRCERHAETALRLDRECLSAAMAQSMLFAHKGENDKSQALQLSSPTTLLVGKADQASRR